MILKIYKYTLNKKPLHYVENLVQRYFTRNELDKITDRLDPDESIIIFATQSRIKPGGAAAINPSTIFVTEKRVIIRNPTRLGLGENIEEYYYSQITNIRLEKGMFSSSLVFAIPGMTEISKEDRNKTFWGRDSNGVIDAISKESAEKIYQYIRKKIAEQTKISPINILKTRYAQGEITKGEYSSMKEELESNL